MKQWYLIKTKPKQETLAILNLQNQDYHAYCPCAEINNKTVILFPGYIFVHLDKKSQNWSPIRSSKGVLNFVRFGLNFAKIPDGVIQLIKSNELATVEKIKNFNSFKTGDKVKIRDGVFKNYTAIFKSFKSDDRVILLMNLLGQQQTINVKSKSLIGL